MVMGRGFPAASALARKASMWRPGAKKMESSSFPWTQMRWMVKSLWPVSGSVPWRRPRQK